MQYRTFPATGDSLSALGKSDFDDVEPAWAAVERERPSWVSYGQVSG